MRYAPDRAGDKSDLAATLKVCPFCLGDLITKTEAAGAYYACVQCHIRVDGRSRSGRILNPPLAAALGALAVPPARPTTGRVLMN